MNVVDPTFKVPFLPSRVASEKNKTPRGQSYEVALTILKRNMDEGKTDIKLNQVSDASKKLKSCEVTETLNRDSIQVKDMPYEHMIYTGPLLNGRPNGEGMCQFPDDSLYAGTFFRGFIQGYGKLLGADRSLQYEGFFQNNLPHGKGKLYLTGGKFCVGSFFEGSFKQGTIYLSDGSFFYKGAMKNNKPHGLGLFVSSDGRIFKGHFQDGVLVGEGELLKVDCKSLAFQSENPVDDSWPHQ